MNFFFNSKRRKMLFQRSGPASMRDTPRQKKITCNKKILLPVIVFCLIVGVFMFVGYILKTETLNVNVVKFHADGPILITSDKFLSVALDSAQIANGFKFFNTTNPKLINMMKHLSPSYLRIGGNLADRLIFSLTDFSPSPYELCTFEEIGLDGCNMYGNFTMNLGQWLDLVDLANSASMELIFDLNSILRFGNGSWDYTNAELLMKVSNGVKNIHWELGNEPNSYRHKFDLEIRPEQLAEDFKTLSTILRKYPSFNDSLLIGPDVTRPYKQSLTYLNDFLSAEGGEILDAISFHQYYFNGRIATAENFLDPAIFDALVWEINSIKKVSTHHNLNKPIWLGETSSAWGGGAPKYSDSFIGSFIWLDKLGLSAKLGLDVVIRQSIFGGYYALLDEYYDPNPDYWISLLYKKLVGKYIVPCLTTTVKEVRLYCQTFDPPNGNIPTVTVFGMNMGKKAAKVRIEGYYVLYRTLEILQYLITNDSPDLLTKNVFLNGRLLQMRPDNELPMFLPVNVSVKPYLTLPPYSMVFWVVPGPKAFETNAKYD